MAEISKNNARMQKILLYLKENYTRKLTLKEIADHIHLSRSECSRFFHSMTGQTLFHYLNELRINRSAELLIHTEKSAAEIAYESGFCSQSYFNQRFRAAGAIPKGKETLTEEPAATRRLTGPPVFMKTGTAAK